MSDFEHDFRPEVVPGVLDIETLGVSPYLLETLHPEDARSLLLAMGKSIQTVAHPDRANTGWTGPEVNQVTYSVQVIKALSAPDFDRALTAYIDNAAVIREDAFEALRTAKHTSEALNQRLGKALLGVVTNAKSVYAHTNGIVFSNSLWVAPDVTETMYKLRLADGEVTQANRIDREARLIESLPTAIQSPLRQIDEELRSNGDDSRVIVVASDGRIFTSPERFNRQNLVETDLVVPHDDSYPLAQGSYVHFKDAKAKSGTKTKLGAHIFSDNGIVDDVYVQKLVGSQYIGSYAVGAAPARTNNKELSRIIHAQDFVDDALFRHGIVSDADLAMLIANGLIALDRHHSGGAYDRMVYRTTKKSKNIAFLPGELLTVN